MNIPERAVLDHDSKRPQRFTVRHLLFLTFLVAMLASSLHQQKLARDADVRFRELQTQYDNLRRENERLSRRQSQLERLVRDPPVRLTPLAHAN